MFGAIAAGISGLTNLGSQALQGRQSRRNLADQHRYNLAMSEHTYGKDLEMWQRQNEYNSPQQQMQRFEDAGLNPNLMYGKGTPGNATQLPKYQAPRTDFTKRQPYVQPGAAAASALSMYQNWELNKSQIDNVKADTEAKKATTELTGWKAAWEEISRDARIGAITASTNLSKARFNSQRLQNLFENYLMYGGRGSIFKGDAWSMPGQSYKFQEWARRQRQIEAQSALAEQSSEYRRLEVDNYVYNLLFKGLGGLGGFMRGAPRAATRGVRTGRTISKGKLGTGIGSKSFNWGSIKSPFK